MSDQDRKPGAPGGQPGLEELKRSYRAIVAPPELAARVASRLPNMVPQRSWLWRPVVAAAAIALVLVVVGPQLRKSPGVAPSTIPSLAQLAEGLPNKPETRLPSLAGVKGVTTPAVPKRPPKTPVANPRSQLRDEFFQDRSHKENTHG